jgi:hypothetical protein
LRSWIDDQNSKVVGKEKEAKEKLHAAKDKVTKLIRHASFQSFKIMFLKSFLI